MNDYRGTPLEIGDHVAVIGAGFRHMVTAKILKFTLKEMTVIYLAEPGTWLTNPRTVGPYVIRDSRPSSYVVKVEV